MLTSAEEAILSPLQSWGIQKIRNVQTFKSPGLTAFMKAVSSLGSEYFYLVIVLFIFWCVNEKRGFLLGMLVVISSWINVVLKLLFDQPRPFELIPALGLAVETSRSFPSGHAQMSMTFWTAVAFYLSFHTDTGKKFRPLIWPLYAIVVFLIGLSRVYLGVHFPIDVLAGWIIALIILTVFLFFHKKIADIFSKAGKRPQLVCAAIFSLLMNVLSPHDTSLSAMLLGFCVGYSLMISGFPFTVSVPAGKGPKLLIFGLRFAIGLAGAAFIYFGLKFIFPGKGSIFDGISFLEITYEIFRFIRYCLLGLWTSAGAILVFQKLGLAASKE